MHEPSARRSSAVTQTPRASACRPESHEPRAAQLLTLAQCETQRPASLPRQELFPLQADAQSRWPQAPGHADRQERLIQQLPEGSVGDLLTRALQLGLAVKVSALTEGRFQHWCSPLQRVTLSHPWLLAEGSGGTLRLREDEIAGIWLLRQPCVGGLRCWLELVDEQGALLATLGSAGAAGQREPCEWHLLLESLCEPQPTHRPFAPRHAG